MRKIYLLVYLLMLFTPLYSNAQLNVSPFIAVGHMSHLGRTGVNTEVGANFQFVKRMNIITSFRYSSLDPNSDNQIKIRATSSFVVYRIISKEKHQLMVGPGICYGNYERYTSFLDGFEKETNGFWINPLKIRYDYTLPNKMILGVDLSLYGDDGDGTTFIGAVFGYRL